jgi:hypothetical protein
MPGAAADQTRAFGEGIGDVGLYLLDGLPIDERPFVDALLRPRPHLQILDPSGQKLREGSVDAILDQ